MGRMALVEAFVSLKLHVWVAALCLVAVVYKVAMLLERRRVTMRNMEAFPGPRPHWLMGNVFEVIPTGQCNALRLHKLNGSNCAVVVRLTPFDFVITHCTI